MPRYEFRMNGAGYTAFLQGGPVWYPPDSREKIVGLRIDDNGGNQVRAEITYFLLRKWFIGKTITQLKEVL